MKLNIETQIERLKKLKEEKIKKKLGRTLKKFSYLSVNIFFFIIFYFYRKRKSNSTTFQWKFTQM